MGVDCAAATCTNILVWVGLFYYVT
jgi:hypothetical protein